jgi:hypothetical protein
MLVSKQKFNNFLFRDLLVCLMLLLNSFFYVWGPAPCSVSRNNYYVSFIDNYSKFTWIYMLKHKSEVFEKFHLFQKHFERLLNRKILAMQTD